MDRKDFIKKTTKATLFCCGAASTLLGATNSITNLDDKKKSQTWIDKMEKQMVAGSESPVWMKQEKSLAWIQNIVDNIDQCFDSDTKKKLMGMCGKACYNRAFGVAPDRKPSEEAYKKYIESLKQDNNDYTEDEKSITIIFNWGKDHQNPWGLIMSDGYCMCPIVEPNEVKISGTFCQCSAGYVKEIFERSTGKAVTVEVISSLKTGGDDCIFKVVIDKT